MGLFRIDFVDFMKRKVMYITGTRADYGLMHKTLELLNNDASIQLDIVATGMHLMEEFGYSVDEIKKDNFDLHIINRTFLKDNKESMSLFIGGLIVDLTKLMSEINPDIVLLLGDRGEMLAGAVVASYLQIPIAHVHGGDVSSTVDDSARHAITKLANIHFPATKKSASRIKQMGETTENIFVVGAPGLDDIIHNVKNIDLSMLKEKYSLNKPFVLILQHPVSLEEQDSAIQIKETLDAVSITDYQGIVIYPNADAGGRAMIDVINQYDFDTYKNIPRNDFIGLLSIADILIGNSSSGIIESSSLKLPVINIGTRQQGREKAENVVDVDYNHDEIYDAINFIKTEEYQDILKNCINPYGEGKASERIYNILKSISINNDLLNKQFKELM